MRANNRGIGYMEQFTFPEAVDAFEEAHRLYPAWRVARINLGIGYMNLARKEGLSQEKVREWSQKAIGQFQSVLAEDPKNCHANYCMGFTYLRNLNEFEQAVPFFRKVIEVDPNDAATWYMLGQCYVSDQDEADKCYAEAYRADPYMSAALNQRINLLMRQGKEEEADKIVRRMSLLKPGDWGWYSPFDDKYYSTHGKYALVIGRVNDLAEAPHTGPIPSFRPEKIEVELATGARWATTADFGQGTVAEVRKLVRQRFGAVMVVLDYDRDGLPDLFLLGAVFEDGKVRDALLHNDGKGHFTDVTAKAGLAGSRPSLGCTVADFDNDGFPDLFITGAGEQHLFRNGRDGKFDEVTVKAGLDKNTSVCLGSAFVDLDQDGDLDLLVAQYAATPEDALAALKGTASAKGAGVALYLNVGEAPVQHKGDDPPPLTARFRQSDKLATVWSASMPAVGFAVGDFSGDQVLDVVALADREPPTLAVNDRLLDFHKSIIAEKLIQPGRWNGALTLDTNRDEQSDLFFVGPDQPPRLLIGQPIPCEPDAAKGFKLGSVSSPPLLQAVAIDLDLDGWVDIVGLSKDGQPVYLHNDGKQLVEIPDVLRPGSDWKDNIAALAASDFNDDGLPDVLVWSEGVGLRLLANQGNGNYPLEFYVTGHRHVEPNGSVVRCNADGIGVWAIAQAVDHRTGLEYTTLSAGLAQSMQPIVLGLGKHEKPDVLLLRWPDLCTQAEFDTSAIQPGNKWLQRIEETNRKQTCCPILFTWNGEQFVFVTDFLGAGSVGELEANGSTRPPRPEESVKIEASQLKPLKGKYVLKLAEPMDEVTLLDRLQLVVMDHPSDTRVFPDERFPGEGPAPTQDLLAIHREIFPVKAVDHRGKDVTKTLREWDRDTVRDFAIRSWLGFAEEHWVELDFGGRLAEFGAKEPLVLCLAGWTDYPYPESIYAAEQAGIALLPPVLERQGADGKWEKVCQAGFPAGLPRMMTLDVTGKLAGPTCKVRLRTNMQVFWDQIFVAPLLHRVPYEPNAKEVKGTDYLHVTALNVESAVLSPKPCMLEYSPDGRQPTLYDYDRRGTNPSRVPAGRITRYGNVTELLTKSDDCFVIFGPGDELTVNFDAERLPPLRAGWTREFVLRSWGYCKDCAPFTATGETIEPLPFRGMDTYPPQKTKYPDDALHNDYRKRYNTRPVGKPRK
jgi:hypothetical protein